MTDLNTLLIFMLGILHLILHMPKDCFVFLFVWPLGTGLYFIHAAHRHQKKRMLILGFMKI